MLRTLTKILPQSSTAPKPNPPFGGLEKIARHLSTDSMDSTATTVESDGSGSEIPFEEFIKRNIDTWLNNVEELCFSYLRDKDKQKEVISDRQSITYQSSYPIRINPTPLLNLQNGFCEFELEVVFQDLASKYSVAQATPRSDITEGFNFRPHGHPHDNLINAGFTEEELSNMSLADAILYDAVIFSAQSWAGHLSDCLPYMTETDMAETYKPLLDQVSKIIEQKILETIQQHREIQQACATPISEDSARSSLTSIETLSDTAEEDEKTETSHTAEIEQLRLNLANEIANHRTAIQGLQAQHSTEMQRLQNLRIQDQATMAAEHQKALTSIKVAHAAEIEKLKVKQLQDATKLRDTYELNLKDAIVKHNKAYESLRSGNAQTAARLKTAKEENTQLQAQITALLNPLPQTNSPTEAVKKPETTKQEIQTDTAKHQEVLQPSTQLLSGLSYEILGGFIAVMGISAVALAIAALSMASLGALPAAVLIVGGALLAAGGFFCGHKGALLSVAETQCAQQCAL